MDESIDDMPNSLPEVDPSFDDSNFTIATLTTTNVSGEDSFDVFQVNLLLSIQICHL